jgi:molybdopterin synthase catalytic subunit/molybdopterin converting factor small subunit
MITVKLFAAAADAVGARRLEGDWAGRTPTDLLAELQERYPRLAPLVPVLGVAINREYASPDQVLQEGDEVALIPPVSGGAPEPKPLYEITAAPLSADEVAARVTNPYAGATLVFVGTVREWTKGKQTVYLEYEAYPEMATAQMAKIGDEIAAKWPGARTAIVHRVGKLGIGEASVVIAVATPHRADAFEACRHAIERLKQIVPIWKKEIWADGEEWVGSQTGPAWMREG